ncbi:acyl-coenzyme A synthetase ACSM3, mitochondrial-like isoform X2 [Manacus candei]|uniref:acyl-coenzyme A synthetase ACSM3, mitochondrial-like isoform X2 n=1 Tax=Manacus candei TaxID=415023 RepID=UPI00222680B4|nr:acyl-coenzyme A synthetase ACSM3, mitochondrial-like isoform X2 [Manacus candei]XP_051662285.1 acyl-coenzyme A synthetase ACSM3, mitochondrial-like isoform X2 [Manacus candei]XP_051662372.1 acyl-coenzyme A synthetase ACSM3, mitochondrial-like isoform X2 [Manacus candei]XP_051662458.1 acyl-coenzyme A synthetase ACSM3, mitochondrial-like isoform X2 [Manacus candei]XP_051662546.1 acyl-coenzyme A synthetase ACSM3, mitochondrial-like isoform X2 [Manacus candei]XP_051662639.1 acyl-coenzyme A synt
MRMFIKSWIPRCLQILRSPCRSFHGYHRLLTSQIISHYEAIHQYKKELPKYFNFASDVLDEWSQLEKDGRKPANPAFWWVNEEGEEVKWSFEELGFLSRKAANVLSEACGLQRGDRVIAVLPRVPEWWLLSVACMRTGIIFVPGTSQLTAKDISYRLQASKAKCIITSDTLAPAVESVVSDSQFLKSKLIVGKGSRDGWLNLKELIAVASAEHECVKTRSQDPMLIYFTSGTTGFPKMVVQSHSSYGIGLVSGGRRWMNLTPSDIMWNTSDTGWAKAAWGSVFAPWICGSCVFVHHMPQFKPAVIAETLSRYPITTFCTAPTAFRMLVQHDLSRYKMMSLKHCISAGEPLNPEMMAKWKSQTGVDIHEGYGQTETVTICANMKGTKIKPGSLGKALPPFDVQIIDDHGAVLPAGEEGSIAVRIQPTRPFCLFSEYLDNPEKTAATVRGNFYVTGDRGIMDEEGYIWFVGRDDDIINSAGYRIGPFEVESALIQHPAVAESAVVSSPDPDRGEVVKAFIVLTPAFASHDPEKLTQELQQHVKKVTAPYKYPRKVEFVQDLPKTVSGKIQRKVLRNREWGRE